MEEEIFVDVVFTTFMDDELDSLNIHASLELVSIETEERKTIGYANFYIFNEFRVDSWIELLDNADAISGDVLEVIDILDQAKENEEIYGLIAVLDHIEIDKDFCALLMVHTLSYDKSYLGDLSPTLQNLLG